MARARQRRRLVLLTSHYPFASGDGQFVRHEIDALSERFDEIVVMSHSRSARGRQLTMPENVSYLGVIGRVDQRRAIRALLTTRLFLRFLRATWLELVSGALLGNLRPYLIAVISGIRIAVSAELKRWVDDPSATTTVYSFWGMNSALALPWIPRASGGIFVRLHRYDLYEEEQYLPLRRALFTAATKLLTVSEHGRGYLLSRYPTLGLEQKAVVSRLGTVSPEATNPVGEGTASKRLVSCSSVSAVKRVDRIVDALSHLRGGTTVQWTHFGGGEMESMLRRRAAEVDREGIEVSLKGVVDNTDILEYYGTVPIGAFVNVSASEGVPVSIMEAMSFGIPVVATDVGGTSEIVGRRLGSGELIPADFTDGQLAEAIETVLNAPVGTYRPREVWERLCDRSVTAAFAADIIAST